MKIKSITPVGKQPVYDIAVNELEHYILENGVITHNSGILYAANTAFIIGKQQIKDGKTVTGYNFILNAEKSRYVKEKSKFPFSVDMDEGISRYSGLLELALESGHVVKPSNGWYSHSEVLDKKYRIKDLNDEFWEPILNDSLFQTWINKRFKYGE
jgi:hypothetical protein